MSITSQLTTSSCFDLNYLRFSYLRSYSDDRPGMNELM